MYGESLALSACLILALLLVLAHFEAVELPGCGTVSDCTRAAHSRWGKLPGTDWPLSFVGFGYFQALLATSIYSRGRLPNVLRGLVVLGAVMSVALTAVMFAEGYVCGYCLAIHGLNITFAIGDVSCRRWAGHRPVVTHGLPTSVVFVVTFALTSLLLAIVDHRITKSAEVMRGQQLQQALQQAANSGTAGHHAFGPGRYVLGPESARVHVTIVSDYQCPSCRAIDTQLRTTMLGRDDIALSARHFPFCTDCNPHIDKTRHRNACRAALAAEAAGQLGGATAFWRMHDWLFAQRGQFTDDQLRQFAAGLRLDWDVFLAAMRSDEALALIRADAAAADAAGLRFTPMIFINGVPIDAGR
jgi:protein-disulfide isomerase